MATGLHDKVVLITGANNPLGIGAAMAHAFAREGAKVVLTYLHLAPETHGFSTSEVAQATTPGLPYYHAMRMKSVDGELHEMIRVGTALVANLRRSGQRRVGCSVKNHEKDGGR